MSGSTLGSEHRTIKTTIADEEPSVFSDGSGRRASGYGD